MMHRTPIMLVAVAALPLAVAGCSMDSQTGKRTGTGAAWGGVGTTQRNGRQPERHGA